MADQTTMFDLRRTDERTNVRLNPFWMTSALMIATEVTAKAAVLFSFTAAGGTYMIHEMVYELIVAYEGGSPIVNIGLGTIATDAAVNGDTFTVLDSDEYFDDDDITEATPALYTPAADGDGGWAAAKLAGDPATTRTIIGLDASVPCIYANCDTGLTSGSARLHVLLSKLPVT